MMISIGPLFRGQPGHRFRIMPILQSIVERRLESAVMAVPGSLNTELRDRLSHYNF